MSGPNILRGPRDPGRHVFIVSLRAEPHVSDPTKALRSGLKRLLRSHGLRCVAIAERPAPETGEPPPTDGGAS
jgi:hypothetical protein